MISCDHATHSTLQHFKPAEEQVAFPHDTEACRVLNLCRHLAEIEKKTTAWRIPVNAHWGITVPKCIACWVFFRFTQIQSSMFNKCFGFIFCITVLQYGQVSGYCWMTKSPNSHQLKFWTFTAKNELCSNVKRQTAIVSAKKIFGKGFLLVPALFMQEVRTKKCQWQQHWKQQQICMLCTRHHDKQIIYWQEENGRVPQHWWFLHWKGMKM